MPASLSDYYSIRYLKAADMTPGMANSDASEDHGMEHGMDHAMDHGMDHGLEHAMDHGVEHGLGDEHGSTPMAPPLGPSPPQAHPLPPIHLKEEPPMDQGSAAGNPGNAVNPPPVHLE
ncbi:copper resistance protein B-like [Thrips palmi]|uniref:Copper resistance protein B-like n=1 Tax=Thrips palmi TaxID=161013 RepID=A0A6P9A3K3_THRPL|nr:copper resistance protein B-like [Thrips palmi]